MTKLMRNLVTTASVLFCLFALDANPRPAYAHNTTGICWEDFSKNTFALDNDYYTKVQGGAGFFGWSMLNASGALAQCSAGGTYAASTAANCWMWRHRCGGGYIRVGADYHIHVPDYLGKLGPAVARGPVQAHTAGYLLHIWMEQGVNHALVDFNYIQIKGTVNAILSVKDDAGVWWDSGVLTPNTGDFYYDISNFGWEIREATLTNVAGAGAAPQLGGAYILTP